MELKRSIDNLYARIEELLYPIGFKTFKSKNEVKKGTKKDWFRISFDMNKMYDFTYNINCQFAVRNGLIRNHFENILERDGLKGDQWFSIMYRPYKLCECYYPGITDWESESDIETNLSGKVVDFRNSLSIDKWFLGFERFMNQVGYDFFNRFENLKGFDKWLNEPILTKHKLTEVYIYWDSFSGLIAAKLCKNPQLEVIFKIWMTYFEKVGNTEALMQLINLKEYLDMLSK